MRTSSTIIGNRMMSPRRKTSGSARRVVSARVEPPAPPSPTRTGRPLQTSMGRGHSTVQLMNFPLQRLLDTSDFERKHTIHNTSGNPADDIARAIGIARRRLLTTTHNRDEGRVSAATYFILTPTKLDNFRRNAGGGQMNGHAFDYAVTVGGDDTPSLLMNGTFDVGISLRSQYSIDHLENGGYRGAAVQLWEYQDTFLVRNTRVYRLANDQFGRVASDVTCFVDKIGGQVGGFQCVDIYNHNSGVLGPLVQQGVALYVETAQIGEKHDYFVTPGFFCW